MFRNIDVWLVSYLKHLYKSQKTKKNVDKTYIIFSICDHFEPYWKNDDDQIAQKRVLSWYEEYPKIAGNYVDCCGQHPRHIFYYPIEEYRKNHLDMLAELTSQGFGEVEVHLHHDNDTSENLRRTLMDYKTMLRDRHGLLCVSKETGEVQYGFIHGDWALDNSSPDGRHCGVNDELTVLQETGCYADFTMPSAPSRTQTKTINSIYYAIDDPRRPKSHNTGIASQAGKAAPSGLLCVQGPLMFNFYSRAYGIAPRIENATLSADYHFSERRLALWMSANVHVIGRPDVLFLKLHTHGTQPAIYSYLCQNGGLHAIFSSLTDYCSENKDTHLIFGSSRQMYNIIKGIEADANADPVALLDFALIS